MIIQPLTSLPTTEGYLSIHQRAILLGTDLARDRGQLSQLVGAVKQREFSETQILASEITRAAEIDQLIKDLNDNESRRADPWYKKIFGK